MEDGEPSAPTLIESLRRLAAGAASTVQNRIELFAVELQEEKSWLVWTFLWAAACVAFGILAVISVSVTIVWLSPPEWRSYELVALSLLLAVAFVSAVLALRKLVRERPPPLADTVSELKKDIEWIRSRD
jgi:uncharacterized membrane protein YqjE